MRAVWQELLPLETDKTGRWKRNSNNLASVWRQQVRTRKTHTSLAPHRLLSVFTWLTQAARVARGLECKSGDQALGALGEVGELGRSADSHRHSLVNAARMSSLYLLSNVWQLCSKPKALQGRILWLITHCLLRSKHCCHWTWSLGYHQTNLLIHWLPWVLM